MSQENKSQWNAKDVALALPTNPQIQGEMIGEVSDGNLYDIFNSSFLEGNKILLTEEFSDHKHWLFLNKTSFILFKVIFFAVGLEIVPTVKCHCIFQMQLL